MRKNKVCLLTCWWCRDELKHVSQEKGVGEPGKCLEHCVRRYMLVAALIVRFFFFFFFFFFEAHIILSISNDLYYYYYYYSINHNLIDSRIRWWRVVVSWARPPITHKCAQKKIYRWPTHISSTLLAPLSRMLLTCK